MRWIYFFGQGQADATGDIKHLVGGKGASLAAMTRAGLNVPPGFTISADCCRLFYEHDRQWPQGLQAEVRANLERLEKATGRQLGRGEQPLLVAVRSGAAQSMPGMMDTILNVGLNPDCVRAVARRTGNAKAAWRAYLHFLLMFTKTVFAQNLHAVSEGELAGLVEGFLKEQGVAQEEELTAGQIETLCQQIRTYFHDGPGLTVPTEPWDQLLAAVNAVFSSWNSDRAKTYRQHHRIEGLLGTAVNVQAMCPSEVAGVMFTAHPVNPALEQMLIEAAFGLGETVVLGKVTPDRYVLDRQSLQLVEKVISRKDAVMAALGEGKNQLAASRDGAALTDAQVEELGRLGQRVEAFFKVPCDVEWGLAQGQFFLLQSRPIKFHQPARSASVFPADERDQVRREEIEHLRAMVSPHGTVWSRFNLAEILPEPTPMTWSVMKYFLGVQGGMGLMYRDLGFDPDPAVGEQGMFDLVCGRPYCNLTREPRMQYRKLPFEHSFDKLKANPARAMYPQAVLNPARAGWTFWFTLPWLFFRMWWSGGRLRRITRTFAQRFRTEVLPPYLREVDQASREDLTRLTPAQLLERLDYWMKRTLVDFARDSLKPTALAGMALGNLERLLSQRLQPPGKPGVKDPEVAAVGMQRAQALLREMVMGVHPEGADLPTALRELGSGKITRQEFLRHFGHRGQQEMELSRPRWQEDAASLDRLPKESVRPDGKTPEEAEQEMLTQAGNRLAMEAYLLPPQRAVVQAEVDVLRNYMGLREAAKHHFLRGYALIRACLVELDRRFQLEGGIFFLTLDELPRLLGLGEDGGLAQLKLDELSKMLNLGDAAGAAVRQDLLSLIAQRRRRRQIALNLPVPQVIFSDDLDAVGREMNLGTATALQGVPLSAGIAEGTAWVLEEATSAQPPAEDYILVCPSTDPAWVPLFVQARGLVMETGGVLSHGAIVAREFGLPAVAGIADVHRRLATGQRLRIDGATGLVSVLSE
jgi:pyruvate,water dikinase